MLSKYLKYVFHLSVRSAGLFCLTDVYKTNIQCCYLQPTLLWPFLWSVHTLKEPCISSFPSSLRFPCEHQNRRSHFMQPHPLQSEQFAPSLCVLSSFSSVAIAHQVGFRGNKGRTVKDKYVLNIFCRYFCVMILPVHS